jgi:glycerophosphoryl diester phosphodiesterase
MLWEDWVNAERPVGTERPHTRVGKQRPLVIAHRGASRQAAENTLAAFRLAVAQRADMIETDLHLTRDGQVVLVHDSKVGGRDVVRLTRAELAERMPEIPTLEEALEAVGRHIPFNLEIKPRADGDYAGIVDAARRAVSDRGLQGSVLWSSFAPPALEALRQREPSVRLGVLVAGPEPPAPRAPARPGGLAPIAEPLADALAHARALGAEAVHPHLPLVTPELVAALHAAGLAVHVFTVDDPADMRRLLAWGVDGIFTNFPAQLRQLLG